MTPTRMLASLQPTRTGTDRRQRQLWKVWSTLAGVGAGLLTRTAIQTAWTARTGEEPPSNPADPGVAWPQALAWSAGLGVGVGVARTIAERGAARAWTEATGELPPGFGEVAPGRAW